MNKLIKLILPLVLLLAACEDFDEINRDPNNPVDAAPFELLPVAQSAYGFVFANNLNRISATLIQQLNNSRFEYFNLNGGDVVNDWNTIFRGLRNLEEVIDKSEVNGNTQYVGIGKIQKAYIYSMMVDLWGDLPFTEALEGEQNLTPDFDQASLIYDQLFILLDQGINALESPDAGAIENDIIYEGNKDLWIKMANTLKLKLYNQIRLARPAEALAGITNILQSDAPLISNNGENFEFPFTSTTAPENRNPMFQTSYVSKGENDLSVTFDSLMEVSSDPRYPYYIYHQDDEFIGRFPADDITPREGNEDDVSVLGIYPAGGLYDDGAAITVSAQTGSGNAPLRMITYFTRKFIEAEAALTLGTPGDPRELLQEGIQASFNDINEFVRGNAPVIGQDTIDYYINERLTAYDAATTDEERLAVIMLEKYKSLAGNNAIESYTDYRRTGYPELNDPLNPEGPFPLRLPYQTEELLTNPNAPESQPPPTAPIFWDVNDAQG